MGDYIFLRQSNGELHKMRETPYSEEIQLQRLLADYPDLMPGSLIDAVNPRRWLLIDREVPLPDEEDGVWRFTLDHLFLDQDAIPTLVEVKRSSDTRSRREVVAQMLDYAANATAYYSVERMQSLFESSCHKRGRNSLECLATLLGDRAPQEFWEAAETNLRAGRIRMLFVADSISPELRRIVEFLNWQMDPAEVLAIEIRQFVGDGLQTLVPRLFGQVEAKKPPSARALQEWDAESFLKELESSVTPLGVAAMRRLFGWIRSVCGEPKWGRGAAYGSAIAEADHNGFRHVVLEAWTNGRVNIRFTRLAKAPPFDAQDRREELLRRLNAIPGIDLPMAEGQPSFPIKALANEPEFTQFCDVMDWMIQEIRAS